MARRWGLATALAVLFTCMVGGASPASAAKKKKKRACAGVFAVPKAATLQRAEAAVLCLINEERARRRIAAVRYSAELTQAARDHSADMVARQYFDHQSLDGNNPAQRVLRTGYFQGGAGTVEETLACGWAHLSTPKALVTSLMRSSTHQGIVLNRSLRDIGIGLVLGGPQPQPGFSGTTLTLDFARR